MSTGGGAGRLLEIARSATHENATLGRILTIFGPLFILGGFGIFVVTLTFPLDAETLLTYQRIAGGSMGCGLPAFLYGLVVVLRSETWVASVSLLGVIACSLAVSLFLLTYSAQWSVSTAPEYVIAAQTVYSLGAMLCSFGVGGAAGCPAPRNDEDEFIWGGPPES